MSRLGLVLSFVLAAPLAAQGGGTPAEIPPGHMPPPGMCRIWIDGVPAGRQPAPTDCATAIRRRPPNARVIFGPEPRDANAAKGAASRIPLPQFRDDRAKEPVKQPLKEHDVEPQPTQDAEKRREVQRPREEERGKGKAAEPRPTPPAPRPPPPRPRRPPGNGFGS